jgi:hypothetical protein
MSLIVPTSCFLDLGCDPEQIATIANGLVVIDFGAVTSDRGALVALIAIGHPSRAEFRLPYFKSVD